MSRPRALIVRAPGTNCDAETALAFKTAGARVSTAAIGELLAGSTTVLGFDVFVIPGGFSYGDDIASGRILANELKRVAGLTEFIAEGRLVLGVCNGFQALVKAGFLPDGAGPEPRQTASLTFNDSGRFVCRWVRLRVSPVSPFLKGLPETIELPVAHGEGKFAAPNEVLDRIEGQVALRYIDNPNGSLRDIAGLANAKGNVLGLMPHPERFLSPWHHPEGRRKALEARELGLAMIENAVRHAN